MHFPKSRRILLGLVAAVLVVLPAAAEQPSAQAFTGFQGKSKQPIQIDATALEISETDTQRIAIFEGNVTVTRGDTIMKAGTMTIYSDKKTAAAPPPAKDPKTGKDVQSMPFTRLEAAGGVRVTSGGQVITGDAAVVDMAAHTITLTGNVVLSQGANVITGDKLIVDTTSGKARIVQTPGKQIRGVFTPSDSKPGSGVQ